MKSFLLVFFPIILGHAQTLPPEHLASHVAAANRVTGSTPKDVVSNGIQSRVFPRIMAGNDWETDIVLLNPGSAAVTFQQLFFGVDGRMVPYAIHDRNGFENQATSGIRGVLAPNSSMSLALSAVSATVCEGWSLITYDAGPGAVDGYAILRRKGPGGAFSFEITVPLSSMQDYSKYMPFDNTQGFRSQLTLLNPAGNIASQVQLTYLSPQGTVVFLDSVVIAPGQQMTLTLPDTYPDLANKTGTVIVEANTDRFVVQGMRYNEAYGAVASLPAMNGGSLPSPR